MRNAECGVWSVECGVSNLAFKPNGTNFRLSPEELVILWKHGPIIPAVWALAPDNGGSSVASAKTARKITAPKGRSVHIPLLKPNTKKKNLTLKPETGHLTPKTENKKTDNHFLTPFNFSSCPTG